MTRAPSLIETLQALVPAGVAAIRPYEPGRPIEEVERDLGPALPSGGVIKLASNENPLGPSPRALEAMRRALPSTHRYPDGGSFYLRRALAQHHGVREEQIVIGNGSNELIDLLVRAFCSPGDEVLAPTTTFPCYRLAAQSSGVHYREVSRHSDLSYDLDAIRRAFTPRTRVVFLANPDNPTGVYLGRDALDALVRSLPPRTLLALDEAYFQYATAADYPDGITFLDENPWVVSLRSFSQIFGLAGLRCGYAVGAAEVMGYLHRVRDPFNVNALAQTAALAAIDDREHVERSRALNIAQMAIVTQALAARGIPCVLSQCNFVLFDAGRDARAVFQALLQRGVIVRPMDGWGLPHHVRVTLGTPDENQRFLEALGHVL